MNTILYILLETVLGAGVICAEADSLPDQDQAAIARVALHRAQVNRSSIPVELLAPYQFAKPCHQDRIRLTHVKSFLAGRWGKHPTWAGDTWGFCSPAAEGRVRASWTRRGLFVSERRGHIYWKRMPRQ